MGKIKRNAIFNILLSVSQVLFPLITFPYVSRVLGPQGIGNVSFVDSITQYFILVAALGIPIYGVREIAKVKGDPSQRSRVFSELLYVHLCTTGIAFLLYVGVFFGIARFANYSPLFLIGSGLLFFQAFVMEWLFQGLEEFPYITKRVLLVRILAVGAIFLLVRTADDVLWYYGISLLSVIINAAFNVHYARYFISFRFYKQAFTIHWKPLLYIFSLGIVTSVYTLLDTVILGLLSSMEEVGYYAASMRLIKLVIMIFVAFSTVVIPPLSKAFHEEDLSRTNLLLDKSFGYIVLLSIPACSGIMVVAPLIINLYAGPAFSPAAQSLRIVSPAIVFISLSNIFGMQILNPTNNERLFFKATLVGMLISLVVNFSLIPFLGQIGAAISTSVTELLVLALLVYYALRRASFVPQWVLLWQAILASAFFVPIYWGIRLMVASDGWCLFLTILFSGLFYLIVQVLIFRNPYLIDLCLMFKRKLYGDKKP